MRACFEMGSVCTGALIVVEQAIHLTEYEVTGIELDCKISSQVLVNIFEHNTPLHDGAVIIREIGLPQQRVTFLFQIICRSAKNWEQDTERRSE